MKHYLSAILAFTIWGTFPLVLKPLTGYDTLEILIFRVTIAAICMLFISFLFRRKETLASINYLKNESRIIRKRILVNVLLSAVMLALNWFLFIYVMNAISVNATTLAYLICPILTTVLASIFLSEKLNQGQWFAVVLSLISCVVLAYGHFIDLFYSVIIAFTYAIYLVLQKKNTFQIDKFFGLAIHILVSCVLLLPLLAFVDSAIPKTTKFYSLVSVIAIGYTIIPLFLNIFALKKLDSSIVGTLLYLNPIISFLLAIFYFKEPINTTKALAFGMIFLAVIIFNVAYLYHKNVKKLKNFKNYT